MPTCEKHKKEIEKRNEAIRQDFMNGMRNIDVAAKHGLSPAQTSYIRRVVLRIGFYMDIDNSQLRLVEEALSAKKTKQEIALMLGMPYAQVNKLVDALRAGIEIQNTRIYLK
jgi:transposase-like protein